MSTKRAPLNVSAFAKAAEPHPDPVDSAMASQAEREPTAKSSARQKSRAGKVGVQFWADPEERRRLKRLAVDTDRTVEDLMREAVSDLLSKHGC